MFFWKKKKDHNSDYYELLEKFNEEIKRPGITIEELNNQYYSLLKPAIDHKPYSKDGRYMDACDAQEMNYYKTFYRLSPGYRDIEYEKRIDNYRNTYNMMLKKENQSNSEKRQLTDSILKEGYIHLSTELHRYGNDNKYQELSNEFYKLRNLYYNDLNGKQYYKITLGYEEYKEITEYDSWTVKKPIDLVAIKDERYKYNRVNDKYYFSKFYVPIYAVDDEKGLHDVVAGKPVRHLNKPGVNLYGTIWYTKLDPVDEQTVASHLTFLVDESFLAHNKNFKIQYHLNVEKAQEKCQPYFKKEYDKMIAEQKAKEEHEKATAKTLQLLNKNGL